MKTMTPAEAFATVMGDRENAERASKPFGVEAQEMDGQRMLMSCTLIPKDLRPGRKAFEEVGFVLGAIKESIFLEARFPDGWSIPEPTDRLNSKILDERGRERCSLFYKAAFYDRRADCTLLCRYSIRSVDADASRSQFELVVWDNGTASPLRSFGTAKGSEAARFDTLCSAASAWLEDNYSENKNPLAYW